MTQSTIADTTVLDIPIIIRGRIIEPGDDAIEFGGRVGARFRSPDPRKYAAELVLKNASDLRDLHGLRPCAPLIGRLGDREVGALFRTHGGEDPPVA